MRTHTPSQVEQYLQDISKKQTLKPWQLKQIIHAIQTLFCKALHSSWANQFDWDYWYSSAQPLPNDHTTVARDYNDDLKATTIFSGKPYDPGAKNRYAPSLAEVTKVIRNKNYSIRTVQELLGHSDVSTTMTYTHVLNTPGLNVQSPADRL